MDYAEYVKSQVSDTDWQKLLQMDAVFDSKAIARLWCDFVNPDKRRETEVPFLLSQFAEYENPRIFNAALGPAAATTIGLHKAGIEDIVSNEFDEAFAEEAQEVAQRYGIPLISTSHDWRNLPDEYSETFNAVTCLGNSLTCLFKKDDQLAALANFRKILAPGGKLIIDERNYEQILSGNFRRSGEIVYCGKGVSTHPVFMSPTIIVLEYEPKERVGKANYVVYPFKRGEMESLLRQAGFNQITAFGDYKPDFKQEEPEFITYVCRK